MKDQNKNFKGEKKAFPLKTDLYHTRTAFFKNLVYRVGLFTDPDTN